MMQPIVPENVLREVESTPSGGHPAITRRGFLEAGTAALAGAVLRNP